MKKHKEFICHLIKEHNIKVFAEIGVYKTRTMKHILQDVGEQLNEYWAIDSWKKLGPEHGTMGRKTTEDWDMYYWYACKFMIDYPQVRVIRNSSLIASTLFDKGAYFDFVYLDASHFYGDVLDDIKAWCSLVKEGGILGGHDYGRSKHESGVKEAVNECFSSGKIKTGIDDVWYVEI